MIQRRTSPNQVLLTPLIVGGILLFTLSTGYLVANSRQYMLLGMFVALPLLFTALRFFEHMVLLIPFMALLVPFSLPTGSGSRVSAVMLFVLLLTGIWVLTVIVQRRSNLQRSPLNAPLFSFIAICCIASVWSVAFRDPLLIHHDKFIFVQLGALAAMVLSPAATLLIANHVRSPRQVWWIASLFLGIGTISTLAHFLGFDLPVLNTRGLFPLWFVAVGYAVLIAHPGLHLGWRLALGVVLMLHLYIMGIQGIEWLSGWVPSLVAILAITLFRSRTGFVGLVIVLVVAAIMYRDYLQENVVQTAEETGSFERLSLWQLNLELIENHPLFGTGPAGYALYYVTYHPEDARSTHNNYLDIIAQTGILGVLCWVWLTIAGIREGWAVLRHAPPGSLRTLGLAAAGGLVGALGAMALGDWVIPFAYNQGIEGYRYTVFSWVFLGILMHVRQQIAPPPNRVQKGSGYDFRAI
jgi:O-antigen ligase